MPDRSSSLSPDALRQRQRRDNWERGYRYMGCWVPPEVIAVMVENEWTSRDEVDNRDELGDVVLDMLDCWARGMLKPPK